VHQVLIVFNESTNIPSYVIIPFIKSLFDLSFYLIRGCHLWLPAIVIVAIILSLILSRLRLGRSRRCSRLRLFCQQIFLPLLVSHLRKFVLLLFLLPLDFFQPLLLFIFFDFLHRVLNLLKYLLTELIESGLLRKHQIIPAQV
jgi:hypothetical protein